MYKKYTKHCFQSVWGSYWKDGRWGFKCCHNFVKESYCTGAAGIDASHVDIIPAIGNGEEAGEEEEEEEEPKSLLQVSTVLSVTL